MASIELVDVTKRYGNVTVTGHTSLVIEDGEFLTLLGPSGCGKSTLLNMVAGLEDVTSGEIRMNSRVMNDLSPFERDIAMVFQSYGLYPHMTVGQNIGFSLRLRKVSKATIVERVASVAASLELSHLLDRYPRQLSGGQQQRVALGRAVIRSPQAFLFDEPFSNLDAMLRVKMRSEVKVLHEQLGVTSLFVTHDQEEALSISDRIAVLGGGEVQQIGTPADVYYRPASKYVAGFIGSPQMSILQGDVVVVEGNPVYRVGEVDLGLSGLDAGFTSRRNVDLGVRPEHVLLGHDGPELRIEVAQPVGPYTDVTLGWNGGRLIARVPGITAFTAGAMVSVRLDPQGYNWFDRTTELRLATVASG